MSCSASGTGNAGVRSRREDSPKSPHASPPTCSTCHRGAERLRLCTHCDIVKYCSKACKERALPCLKITCHPVSANFRTGQHQAETRVDLRKADWAYPFSHKRPTIGCDPPQRMCDLPPDPDDRELIAMSRHRDEYPVCFSTLPLESAEQMYQSCCGKIICARCLGEYARASDNDKPTCPMCRAPIVCADFKHLERLYRRVGSGDGEAVNRISLYHQNGMFGFEENFSRAKEIYRHACMAGCSDSPINLAVLYNREGNLWRFCYHMKRAAISRGVNARFSIASMEFADGNISSAVTHWAIGARMGCQASYDNLLKTHSDGLYPLEALLTEAELSDIQRDHNESVEELRLPHCQKHSVKGYCKAKMS